MSDRKLDEPIRGDAPRPGFRVLRRILPRRLQPFFRGLRKWLLVDKRALRPPFSLIYAHTQVSRCRQESLLEKAAALEADGVAGAFVECGVLDGGTAALLAFAARGGDRKVHLFDAWEGLPDATDKDGPGAKVWSGDVVGSPRRVRSVLRRVGARMENVVFHRGWFADTLPVAQIDRIALLHIDCDFYEPTLLVLETLYPRLVSGGWVQIDDYTAFEGCRRAVNEWLENRPEIELTIEEGGGGAIYFRRP